MLNKRDFPDQKNEMDKQPAKPTEGMDICGNGIK